jgi:hypothetical protein
MISGYGIKLGHKFTTKLMCSNHQMGMGQNPTLSSEAAARKAEAVARSRIYLSETKTPVSQLTYPSGFAEPVNYVPHF